MPLTGFDEFVIGAETLFRYALNTNLATEAAQK
jgi:hypothetical protein